MKNIANFLIEKHSPHFGPKNIQKGIILFGNIIPLFYEKYRQFFNWKTFPTFGPKNIQKGIILFSNVIPLFSENISNFF